MANSKAKKRRQNKAYGPRQRRTLGSDEMYSTYIHLLEVHKKMRNLGRSVGECTGIVHIAQEMHKIIPPNSRELKVRSD